jgi:hypothetical protein
LLFCPKGKTDNFDIDDAVLQLLKNYLHQTCVLYVFGNPMLLALIPDLQSVSGLVQVYQTLEILKPQPSIT